MVVERFPGLDRSRRRLVRLRRAAPQADDDAGGIPSLRLRAAELQRAVETRTVAPRWRLPGFSLEVDRIRAQLAPIELRGTLAASFEREAGRRLALYGAGAAPLDLAYAVRWLELDPAGRRAIPAWAAWLSTELD